MAYLGVSPSNGVRKVHTYTATASQTTFRGAGAENISLSYRDSTYIDVYQNGVKLGDADYTATSGTSVVLGTGATASDLVVVVVYDVFSVADTVSKTDGGQFDGNVTMAGTLGVTGAVTANAGVNIDNITIDGTEIDLSSGDLTVDVAGDITLNADGGDIKLSDGSTTFGELTNNPNADGNFDIRCPVSDADIRIKGVDGGSDVQAVLFDMSDAGTAVFNHDIKIADNNNIQFGAGADLFMFSDGTDGIIDTLNGDLRLRADPNSGASSSMIKFEVDGSEGMRLISGGKLLVGNTDVGVHICRITGNSGGNAVLKVDNSATSGNTTCYLAFMDGSGGSSVNSAFFQGFNGSNNFYLLGNGTQTFTSDENAKKNIETTRDGYLEDLAKLRVVKYNWKEQKDGEDKELGLIAQEVEKVFPRLVMNDIDPQIEEKDKKKMIKTTVLPFMLLKAVQEANTKITALETENKTQAAQIADLISRITALESA